MWLAPLGEALWEQVNDSHYLQVDETPVKVLDQDKKGYMWCYHNPEPGNRFVLFDYHLSRGSEVPNSKLVNFKGILQTDGYSGYNYQRDRKEVTNVGCFGHCRRKFTDAHKVAGETTKGLASKAINMIAKLYRIETEIKKYTIEAKREHRQIHAKPILEKMFKWLLDNSSSVLPKSKLGNAFTYAINQWSQLSAYIDHGEVHIDNNWVENQIRPFALGRRNWLFIGNERGGHAAALLYSLIQTCKANNINSRAYFTHILNLVPKLRRKEIDAKSILPQFIDPEILK